MSEAHAPRGRFITFEGGEGAGKSTQLRRLAALLCAAGHTVTATREPGGSPGAEIVRHVILSGFGKLLGGEAESLLFAAARDDHVGAVIAPALARGDIVLCDRFFDSTRAYQGHVGDVAPQFLDALQRVTIGALKPDLTIVLDLPAETGLVRAAARRGADTADRFEGEDIAFHQRLRDAFLAIAAKEPDRCVVIDAAGSEDDVAAAMARAVTERLGLDLAQTSASAAKADA